MLKAARADVLLPTLDKIRARLPTWRAASRDVPMLSRTHGQTASPTTVGKEVANVVARLATRASAIAVGEAAREDERRGRQLQRAPRGLPRFDWEAFSRASSSSSSGCVQPVHDPDRAARLHGRAVRRDRARQHDPHRLVARRLGLHRPGLLQAAHGEGEVGSSTMPHKVNPIDFENAEGNFGLANALLTHLSQKLPISRWQRDLTDSTVLRNMGVASATPCSATTACCAASASSRSTAGAAADLDAPGRCSPSRSRP
jgi:adenylosuccinate lyase